MFWGLREDRAVFAMFFILEKHRTTSLFTLNRFRVSKMNKPKSEKKLTIAIFIIEINLSRGLFSSRKV